MEKSVWQGVLICVLCASSVPPCTAYIVETGSGFAARKNGANALGHGSLNAKRGLTATPRLMSRSVRRFGIRVQHTRAKAFYGDGGEDSESCEDEGTGKWAFLNIGDIESMDVFQVKEALVERGLSEIGNLTSLQKRLASALANEDRLALASRGIDEDEDNADNQEWQRQQDERWGEDEQVTDGKALVGVQSYLDLDHVEGKDGDVEEEVMFEVEGTEEEKKLLLKRLYKMQIGWFTPFEEAKGWRPAGVFTPRLGRKKRKQMDGNDMGSAWAEIDEIEGAEGRAANGLERSGDRKKDVSEEGCREEGEDDEEEET